MPSFPSAFRVCPFCGGSLGQPRGIDVAQTCAACDTTLYHSSKPGVGGCLSDLVATPFFSFVGAGHRTVDNGAYPVGWSPTVKPPKPPQFVRFVRRPDWRFGLSVSSKRASKTTSTTRRRPAVEPVLHRPNCRWPRATGDEVTALGWFEWEALPKRLAGPHLAVLRAYRS